jgi:hypothetical protein
LGSPVTSRSALPLRLIDLTNQLLDLRRQLLHVHVFSDDARLVSAERAVDTIKSAGLVLRLDEAVARLSARVRQAGVIPGRGRVGAQLRPIVDAVVEGMGAHSAETLSAYMDRAVDGIAHLIAEEKKRYQPQPKFETVVKLHPFAPARQGRPQISADRTGLFKPGVGYEGYAKSMYEQDWFDSSTERNLANLLDGTDTVEFWARLQIGDLPSLLDQRRSALQPRPTRG